MREARERCESADAVLSSSEKGETKGEGGGAEVDAFCGVLGGVAVADAPERIVRWRVAASAEGREFVKKAGEGTTSSVRLREEMERVKVKMAERRDGVSVMGVVKCLADATKSASDGGTA